MRQTIINLKLSNAPFVLHNIIIIIMPELNAREIVEL